MHNGPQTAYKVGITNGIDGIIFKSCSSADLVEKEDVWYHDANDDNDGNDVNDVNSGRWHQEGGVVGCLMLLTARSSIQGVYPAYTNLTCESIWRHNLVQNQARNRKE